MLTLTQGLRQTSQDLLKQNRTIVQLKIKKKSYGRYLLSVISVESECFEECLITHEASAPESEPIKPEKETHLSPVMPTTPKHSTSGND